MAYILGNDQGQQVMWVTLATRCPGVIPINPCWKETKLEEELVGAQPSFQQTPNPSEQTGNVITWPPTVFQNLLSLIAEVQFAHVYSKEEVSQGGQED